MTIFNARLCKDCRKVSVKIAKVLYIEEKKNLIKYEQNGFL